MGPQTMPRAALRIPWFLPHPLLADAGAASAACPSGVSRVWSSPGTARSAPSLCKQSELALNPPGARRDGAPDPVLKEPVPGLLGSLL